MIAAAPTDTAAQESQGLQNAIRSFPEHADVRQKYGNLISAPLNELLDFDETVAERGAGSSVSIELRQNPEAVYLLFLNEFEGRYPVYGQGAFIKNGDLSDGSFVQVKIFLRTDTDFFVRLFPTAAGSAVMDLYLAGDRVYEGVRLPVSFDRVLRLPFADLIAMTNPMVRWDLVLRHPEPGRYEAVERVARRLREEGASAASRTTQAVLASLEQESAESLPEAILARAPSRPLFEQQASEVREIPFARYIRGRGYRVGELRRLLYTLAITEPGTAYTVVLEEAGRAATRDAQGNQGREMPRGSRSPQQSIDGESLAVLALPRITANGAFEAPIFNGDGVLDLRALIQRYSSWTARILRMPAIE